MEMLKSSFCIKTLEEVVSLYVPINEAMREVLINIGDVLVAIEKDMVFPEDLGEREEEISWEDFKFSIAYFFHRSGENVLLNYTETHPVPSPINVFENKHWQKLYEVIGRKLMLFLFRQSYIFITVSPQAYMCLREEHIREICNKNNPYVNNKSKADAQNLRLPIKPHVVTKSFEHNLELSIATALYSKYHLREWNKHSSLRVNCPQFDNSHLNSVIETILSQNVGIDLKDIMKNDYDNIMNYMSGIKGSLVLMLKATNSRMYPFTNLYREYINSKLGEGFYGISLFLNKQEKQEKSEKITSKIEFNVKEYKTMSIQREKRIANKIKPIPEKKIFLFLCKVITTVVPKTLLGFKNLIRFCKNVERILKFGMNVKLRLCDLLSGINVSNIKWLQKVPGREVKENILAKLCVWLWNDLVKVLIQANFYATEHMSFKNKIMYYEQGQFWGVKEMIINNYVYDNIYLKIQAKDFETGTNINTIATIRLIPKNVGVRVIQQIRWTKEEATAMKYLKIFLHQVNEIVRSHTHSEGSNLEDFHRDWLKLVNEFNLSSDKKLYFVKVDIQDAYGSICHEPLLEYLDHILHDFVQEYQTVRLLTYTCVSLSVNKNRKFYTVQRFEGLPLAFRKNTVVFNNFKSTPMIFNTNELISRLKSFVTYQIVRQEKIFYWIKQGIPQGGSSLSSFLCNLYYTKIENKHLGSFVKHSTSHLFRRFDDFLYITPDLQLAKRFLETMSEGFPEYRVFINSYKTITNIEETDPSKVLSVPFCGYLLTSNMQINNCYNSYNGVEMRYTISINNISNHSRQLKNKMRSLKALKLDKLTLDPAYNTLDTIIQNIYEASTLMAFRFDAYVKYFMIRYTSPLFLIRCLRLSASIIASTVSRHIKVKGTAILKYQCILWIIYKAFYNKLSTRSCVYEPEVMNTLNLFLDRFKWNVDSTVMLKLKDAGIPIVFNVIID